MKKFLVFMLFAFACNLYSQKIPWQASILDDVNESKHFDCTESCCSSKYSHLREQFQSNFVKEPYDVIRYDLFLDFGNALKEADLNRDTSFKGYFNGVQRILLAIDSNDIELIKINANNMNIDDVVITGKYSQDKAYNWVYNDNNIEIRSILPFSKGDTLYVKIDYSVARTNRVGFYLFAPGEYLIRQNKVRVEEASAFTFSQPSWARYWMPCNDKPYDKALSSIAIKVPNGFTTASNGLLDSIRNDESQEFSTYYWSHKSPISTYLMVAAASKYENYEQVYKRHSNPDEEIPIMNFVWKSDLEVPEGHPFNAVFALRNQPEMLRYFSEKFGEYTFEKYGNVSVHPFDFGGMEHQTMTSINRDWLRGNAEIGLAHEAAHHWIGDLITCATWGDIWLNEGGATWFEAVWLEHINKSESRYYQHMLSRADFYFSRQDAHLIPVYNVPENQVFTKTYITYNKAGWIYHMLAEIIGRKEFFDVMNSIFENNKFRTITTYDFKDLIIQYAKNPKMDIEKFFEQWVFDSGHIEYELELDFLGIENGKYNYSLDINQVQMGNGYRDLYEMPIEIAFTDDLNNLLALESVYNDDRNQTVNFSFEFPVKYAFVDNRKVLAKNKKIASSIEEDKKSDIIIFPNPSEDILNLTTSYSNVGKELKIVNLLGELMINSIIESDKQTINVSNLADGVYFVVIDGRVNKFIKN